jgi:hypothetical protein
MALTLSKTSTNKSDKQNHHRAEKPHRVVATASNSGCQQQRSKEQRRLQGGKS